MTKVIKKLTFASVNFTCKLHLLAVITYNEVEKVKTQHSCFVKGSVFKKDLEKECERTWRLNRKEWKTRLFKLKKTKLVKL